MPSKLNISKIIAWIAFAMYIASLFLPFATFDTQNGSDITGMDLKLWVVLFIIIPMMVFYHLRHTIWTKLATFVLGFSVLLIGLFFIFKYLVVDRSYPMDLAIGMDVYFMMSFLFLIASIIKFKIPVIDKVKEDNELLDT
jgi:glucan phosphoethanolaminetransferase (alkaline phosphatase superfamily)